jgi:parallel beta-helix repeat protein
MLSYRERRTMLERKAVSGIMLILLVIGTLTLAFNIQPSRATGPSYTVWTDSGIYYAKDSNGTLVNSSTNASDIINWAMTTASQNGGGTVELLRGTYYLKTTLVLQSDVHLQGESSNLTKITVADSTSEEGFLNYHALVIAFNRALPIIRAEISDLTLDPNSKGITFPLESFGARTRNYYLKVHDCDFPEGGLNSGAAINLWNSVSAEIYNNTMLNQMHGIYVTNTNYTNIHDNYLDTSTWEGFYFDKDCYYNMVSGNTFRNASYWHPDEHEALQMHGSCKYNTVKDNNSQFCINAIYDEGQANIISNNYFNVVYNAIYIVPYYGVSEDIVTGNHIQNATHVGIGIQDGSNVIVSSNFLEGDSVSDGLRAYNSNNVTFYANQVKSVYNGINLFQSLFCTVVGNEIATSVHGIYLSGGSNNTLESNHVSSNGPVGIYLYYSQYNTVSSNIVSNNTWTGVLLQGNNNIISDNNISLNPSGIYVFDAYSNRIFHNNFIDNTDQAYLANPNNIWDDGYPSGGNYWSDYTEEDLNGDGIGDTPYFIDPSNQDDYPLISPYEYWSNPIPGDVNKDMAVDNQDLSLLSPNYGSAAEETNWNPNCDFNTDNIVSVLDLYQLGKNYGKTYP